MHKLILWIFESLKNIEKFCRLILVFLIMILALYWIQNLIEAHWGWMDFFKPTLDNLLNFAGSIYSFKFDFWGKTFELNYFAAMIILLCLIFVLKAINIVLETLEDKYDDLHRSYKKSTEKAFNYGLEKKVELEEKQLLSYMVFVQTRISKKYMHKTSGDEYVELNKKMNELIQSKTYVQPIEKWGGYIYFYENFEHVDKVIDVFQKLKDSESILDYAVCIQIENSLTKQKQLQQLANLQQFGKIILAADTLHRYKYNKTHRYQTSNVGIFQKTDGTLEVHEFKPIL